MSPPKTRILVVDDHELLRRGLRDLFEAEGDLELVGEAASAMEALERVAELMPDVAVLDVRLGDGNGIELCREIRDRHPGVRCLILTSFRSDDALFQAIMAGAAGYVLKEIQGDELVQAVRAVAAGGSLLDPAMTAKVLERLRDGPPGARLTPQERKLLEHIAEGLSNREIAARMFLSEKTVKNYVSNLLAKLGMQRRTQAAVYGAKLSSRDDVIT